MYCLSSSISSRLIPEAKESLPIFHDDISSVCGASCDCADQFYTPPQSPAAWQGLTFANIEMLNHFQTAPSQSRLESVNNALRYPDAPPPTPITEVQSVSEQPLQFWSSDVYKATINFPPSELPEHLRDGSWHQCLSNSLNGEMAVLFGPAAAIPVPTTITQPNDDISSSLPVTPQVGAGLSKFMWGPLDESMLVPPQDSKSQVRNKAENKEPPTVSDCAGSALESGGACLA